ncbi:MAG: sodium:proton antiporter [Deltaproteobacteria bacterium]|nr:sodium:proton antiporter [Deltaproteobacteria bacterium]
MINSIFNNLFLLPAENLGATLPLWSIAPFVCMLLSIAIFPLTHGHWWESNRHKAFISAALGLPVVIYFLISDYHQLIHTTKDYISFIILLASLFTISGGIILEGNPEGTPFVNTVFLAVGAVLASVIGTTGASMVLIRPLLRTNGTRKHIRHIPVFFIFLVSNIGGSLTPIGDPPLFLGYLQGVPFFWTLKLFPLWCASVGILLLIFYLFERRAWKKESPAAIVEDILLKEPLNIKGKLNFLWLFGVVGAVFLPTPYREIIMVFMGCLSYRLTPKEIRVNNKFTFYPINEVAVLFAGIFATMIPALLILEARGAEFGIKEPWHFFWITGSLSSFLDNAPTYITFFSLAEGLGIGGGIMGIPENILIAISAGAVFMGANSYIGNGPNFMVKSICEEAGVKMPSFFGYMLYSGVILIPIFILITFAFFL